MSEKEWADAEAGAWEMVTGSADYFNSYHGTHLSEKDFDILCGENIISDDVLEPIVDRLRGHLLSELPGNEDDPREDR